MLSVSTYRLRRRSAWLCMAVVLLFGLSAIAEAGHSHDGQSPDSYKNCSVCAGAHLAKSALACTAQLLAPARAATLLVQPAPVTRASRLEKGALYVRPPPAV